MIFNWVFIMLQILSNIVDAKWRQNSFKSIPPIFCVRYTINQCDLIHHVYVYRFLWMITQKTTITRTTITMLIAFKLYQSYFPRSCKQILTWEPRTWLWMTSGHILFAFTPKAVVENGGVCVLPCTDAKQVRLREYGVHCSSPTWATWEGL